MFLLFYLLNIIFFFNHHTFFPIRESTKIDFVEKILFYIRYIHLIIFIILLEYNIFLNRGSLYNFSNLRSTRIGFVEKILFYIRYIHLIVFIILLAEYIIFFLIEDHCTIFPIRDQRELVL